MKRAKIVLDEFQTKFGYVIRKEIWDNEDEAYPDGHHMRNMEIKTCYTNDGYWIGDEETAKFLCEKKGIAPENWHDEVKPGDLRPCQIGFCEKEQKWYGWSHRAIWGFGIGDVVKGGHCTAESGWSEELLEENPEMDKSLPVGFKAETLDDAKKMAIAYADNVS